MSSSMVSGCRERGTALGTTDAYYCRLVLFILINKRYHLRKAYYGIKYSQLYRGGIAVTTVETEVK